MAATANITINNHAAVAKTFAPSVAVPNGFDYRETSSSMAAPLTLRVTHVIPAPGSKSNTKAGVRFVCVGLNASSEVKTGYIDVVISQPKDGVTDANISDLGAYVRNFLTDANIKALLQGAF